MLRDDDILEPILENLHMPELVEELNARWKVEQRLREEFYEKIQPGNKWEFTTRLFGIWCLRQKRAVLGSSTKSQTNSNGINNSALTSERKTNRSTS